VEWNRPPAACGIQETTMLPRVIIRAAPYRQTPSTQAVDIGWGESYAC
jgi:hypothetical protein